MNAFHLTLPSDANVEIYPENKANDYKVQLDRSIQLGDMPWEVAVTDMIVPSETVSTDKDAWFYINSGDKFYLPGMHFYKGNEEFVNKLTTSLKTAVTRARSSGIIESNDNITFHANPSPTFTLVTALTKDNRQRNRFHSLVINEALANLLGVNGGLELVGVNYFKQWLQDVVPGGDPQPLWFSLINVNGSEIVFRLPQLHTYRDEDGLFKALKTELAKAVTNLKTRGVLHPYDNYTVDKTADGLTFTISTQLNKLPGLRIQSTAVLHSMKISPLLCEILGVRIQHLINRNYYLDYINSNYNGDKYFGNNDFDAGDDVRGRINIPMKPDGTSQSNPHHIAEQSHNTSTFLTPYKPMGDNCLKTYNRNRVVRLDTLPSGAMVQGTINAARSWTYYTLSHTINVKVGHQQLNLYSDIIQPHYVGGEMTNLLRTVTHKRKRSGPLKEINLTTPYYVPVTRGLTEMKDIRVHVDDEHNHPMPFKEGKLILDLHFRPAKRRKTSQFTIKAVCGPDAMLLEKAIDLSGARDMAAGQWETALIDIQYPSSWKNVLDQVTVNGEQLMEGEYTIDQFLTTLDTLLKKHKAKLIRPRTNENITIQIFKRIKLSQALAQILGLVANKDIDLEYSEEANSNTWVTCPVDDALTEGPGGKALTRQCKGKYARFTFPRKADLSRGFRIFWVYAQELIEAVHVGHVKAELLRKFIPSQGPSGVVHHEFITPHYHPLKKGVTYLDRIKVEIRDEIARHIQFTGLTPPTATLHFQLVI